MTQDVVIGTNYLPLADIKMVCTHEEVLENENGPLICRKAYKCLLERFTHDTVGRRTREFIVEGACTMYVPECLIMLNSVFKAVTYEAI